MQDLNKFRQCLSKFATGVTVVTCTNGQGDLFGITANSFSSVSLDPPLILWNIAKVSNSVEIFLSAEYFAINILASEQQKESQLFARSEHNLFEGVEYDLDANRVPLLRNTLAHLSCRTYDVHEAGDHHTVFGEVTSYCAKDASPLLFFNGSYQSIQ